MDHGGCIVNYTVMHYVYANVHDFLLKLVMLSLLKCSKCLCLHVISIGSYATGI